MLTILETRSCYQRYIQPLLQSSPVMSCLDEMILAKSQDDLRCDEDGAPLYRFFPTSQGIFLAIPRPEVHPAAEPWSLARMRDEGRSSFVAFWVHPDWTQGDWRARLDQFASTQRGGTGLPNAKPYASTRRKPSSYYHTVRDIETAQDLTMLIEVRAQIQSFMQSSFGDEAARGLSCFVQYPSGPIKSTLHIQFWYGYQEGEEEAGRKHSLDSLIAGLSRDPKMLQKKVFCYRVHPSSNAFLALERAPRLSYQGVVILGEDNPNSPEAQEAIDLLEEHGVDRLLHTGVFWRSE